MTDVLLLHGAFRGGWSWSRVVPLLEAAGHRVLAPDLLGSGLEQVLDDLQRRCEALDLRDAVVVGHSQGGFVARALSQRIPDRIAVLAYLDAPVPRHGQTAWELLPGAGPVPDLPRDTVVPARAVEAGEWVTEQDAAWMTERLTPETVALSMDPVVLTDPQALALPEAHAFCRATPESFPCATTRADLDRRGARYDLLDAGHDAPVTHPGLVAAWVLRVAAGVDGRVGAE